MSATPDPMSTKRSFLADLGKGAFWLVVFRGVLAVAFGILILVAPAAVTVALGVYVGAWLIVDGILTIFNANASRRSKRPWGLELAAGIAYIIAGVVILLTPVMFALLTGSFILWLLAGGMIVRGLFSIFSKTLRGWSKALGVLDIIFAVILVIVLVTSPAAAVAALLWIIGIYTIVFGATLITMAVAARTAHKKTSQQVTEAPSEEV
ncbi:HdeD family acid-resistance protein [Brevibacterium oceani]|uniref:HdeD family acid-resistance protein n=1 Tax=Brevibacterium oceani TaxID=358099 RepID=UPI0015E751A6|nr:DUF308 domain-containing protein [Brevibacterium oceani]